MYQINSLKVVNLLKIDKQGKIHSLTKRIKVTIKIVKGSVKRIELIIKAKKEDSKINRIIKDNLVKEETITIVIHNRRKEVLVETSSACLRKRDRKTVYKIDQSINS